MTTYRLGWIGDDSTSCRWLLDRFEQVCGELGYEPSVMRQPTLDLDALAACDRIVYASTNRSDYPHEALTALSASENIVPWAVVTDSWHIGSRRSGDGPIVHWQQPWFRWHDGWLGWFFPEVARPGSLVPNAYGPIVSASDFAMPASDVDPQDNVHRCETKRVAILSACALTGAMLHRQASFVNWQADVYRSLEHFSCGRDQTFDAVVWDDSLLTCLPDSESAEPVRELVGQLRDQAPADSLIASLDLTRLHLYADLCEAQCSDVLIKPSYALSLSNCLYYRSRGTQFLPQFHAMRD